MAHIHEKIDFVTSVFVVYKNKVLLRWHDKYDFWLAVGGHVELDEDPNQTALREVQEEVGLDVKLWSGNKKFNGDFTFANGEHHELIPPVALNRHHTDPTHQHIDLVYFARAQSDKVVPENIADKWKWLTKEDLKSLDLLPDIKFYAELALDTLGE